MRELALLFLTVFFRGREGTRHNVRVDTYSHVVAVLFATFYLLK